MGKVIKKQKGIKGKKVIRKEDVDQDNRSSKSGVTSTSESSDIEADVDSELNDDDEVNDEIDSDGDSQDDASEVEDDSEADEPEEQTDDEEDYEVPKKKKNRDDGSESFANALTSIVGSKLKAYDRNAPIMARNKKVLKKLESDKLEAKAKKALLNEKKQLHDNARVKNLLPSNVDNLTEILDNEKKLRKTAQKGVVRLFNAIISTQVKTTQAIKSEKVGEVKKEELFNEMSKEKFLDLVQSSTV